MPSFIDLLILMAVIWTSGNLFRRVGLPMVFGELVGGIIVGPLLLNVVDPKSEVIHVLAELGIFFLMLHSGLKTDPDELFSASKKSMIIAITGLVIPFAMGYGTAQVFGQTVIASLFIGMGLSVSALALVIRLFKECKIDKTQAANIAVGSAIIKDILALILFAAIINMHETGAINPAELGILLLKICIFFAVVIFGGTYTAPFLNRIIYFGNKGFSLSLIIALLMGLIAEAIGLHMIIGAFLAGLFIREEIIDTKTFDKIEDRVYGLSYSFLGPIFFASLAFHLDISAFFTAPMFLASIIGVAVLGKILGSAIPAKLMGLSTAESWVIGIAMNNRGAVELIIASIGLKKGIIDETTFSILVIMAFATTLFSIVTMRPFAKKLHTT